MRSDFVERVLDVGLRDSNFCDMVFETPDASVEDIEKMGEIMAGGMVLL